MFKENTVITLLVAQDRVPETNEQLTTLVASAAIASLQSDDRIDVVVVASAEAAILAEAQKLDAVNRAIDASADFNDVLQEVIDGADGFGDESNWILMATPVANLAQLVEAAFAALEANPGARAVTVSGPEGSKVELFQAGDFASTKLLPVAGAVSVLV
jgi:hypothetical protein